jgi:hypothetical protein
LVFGFELNLFFTFKIASPGPLNLDSGNVIHGKTMILEQAASKGHLVGRLDESSTEVSKTLILVFVHHVEWRGQELLAKVLGSSQMPTDFRNRFVYKTLVVRGLLSVRVLLVYHRLLDLKLLEHFVNSLHLLQHVLVMHLLLWLSIPHIVSMCLSQYASLDLQLFSLFLQPLLMIVRYEHARLSPLLIEIISDRPLYLDGCQMLRGHWSRPRFLNDSL